MAAPAFAASTDGVTFKWTLATWFPGRSLDQTPDYWELLFEIDNPGTQQIILTQLEVHTTYHAPATNGSDGLRVATSPFAGVPISAAFATVNIAWLSHLPSSVPPRDANGVNLLPSYYNDYLSSDGTIPCVGPVGTLPSSPDYPESCLRLKDDGAYVVISYTVDGVSKSATMYMSDTVKCRVRGQCVS